MYRNLRTIVMAAAIVLSGMSFSATAEKLVDAKTLRVVNRGWENLPAPTAYGRVPTRYQSFFNSTAWGCSYHSAGVGVRFATNSRQIGVTYNLWANTHMNHQAPTGTKGMDLYILDGDRWRHVNTLRPADQINQEGQFVANLDGVMHEYMLYLPTYDGVTSLSVKVDDEAVINSGNYDAIDVNKRVVAYGTSILQGGCSSRTGMCPTAIISRALNCEVINLAFSGGGKMEVTAAQALAEIENPAAYIIDPVPNCDEDMCRDLTYDFVKTIRDAHPGVPVIMVEGQMYPYSRYNSYYRDYLPAKNARFRENYEKLYAENPTNLFYVTAEMLEPACEEGTVDGIHLTDLGFLEYAKVMIPILEPFAKGTTLMAITSPSTSATGVELTPTVTWSDANREGTLEIYTSAAMTKATLEYSAEGTGKVEVPKYALAAGTTYYARVAYDSNGNTIYTPTVSFTTKEMTPDVPTISFPIAGGSLHANEVVTVNPTEGLYRIRLEISSNESSFSGRNIYTSTFPAYTAADSKTGAEIKVGSSAMVNGQTYYARVRGSYNEGGATKNTEYSAVVPFVYRSESGVNDITADGMQVVNVQYFDLEGRQLPRNTQTGQVSLTRYQLSDGSVVVEKKAK